MNNRIEWLGGSSDIQGSVDETLVSVNTYTGEELRLTPEQLAIVNSHEDDNEATMDDLRSWLGTQDSEEAEAFLAGLND